MTSGRVGHETVWGQPSPWCDYSGTYEGRTFGVAIFDHPSNLRHPTRWHVRNYGLFAANCFGLSFFDPDGGESSNGEYWLRENESIIFKYRVYVHTGAFEEARVAEHYAQYIKE